MVLALVSQSFAASNVPCKMMLQHMVGGHQMLHTDHQNHRHSAELGSANTMHPMTDEDAQACCKLECSCPPSGCISLVLAFIDSGLEFDPAIYVQPYFTANQLIDLPIQSLYRPPILA